MTEALTPIIVYPADVGGCGNYRLTWPAEACISAGKPILIQHKMPKIVVDENGNIQGINLGNYKVVVLQRPASYQVQQAIDILHSNGVKVCIDMDDSLSKVEPQNVSYKNYDPRVDHNKNWIHAAKACEMADLVICTTEALAEEYGSHGRVKIIKNHVPQRYLNIPRLNNEMVTVTWAGWTATHPGDLSITSGMINAAIVETGARFMAFGDLNIFHELQIRYRSPNLHHGFEEIQDYPKTLSQADIGIVPLKMSPFNDCKSWLKCLEYAALGIVPVASPTPDNLQFAEIGGCIIAEKPGDWYREVKELILDNDKRLEMSKQVREAASTLTIEGDWKLWWDTWSGV
jgi:glycosyltransferase involved in cell wall biosynthesis